MLPILEKRQMGHDHVAPTSVSSSPTSASNPWSNLLPSLISMISPQAVKPFKIEQLPPAVKRPGAKRARVWYGPFKLKAANVSPTIL
jgi:hypothetical protein